MNSKPNPSDYLEINRANWDSRVPLHLQGYNLDKYETDPSALSDVVRFDLERLGSIDGLRGIHLQCHIGTDTISLARQGAEMVGLDLSPASIVAAREIANRVGNEVTYVESDVYHAVNSLKAAEIPINFDFVYTGVGALCWLPDINRWAETVSSLLKPGGFLFIREGHPMLWAMGDEFTDGRLSVDFNYFAAPGNYFEEEVSYAGSGMVSSPGMFCFNHGLAEIMNALKSHGMNVEIFEEHRTLPWNPYGEACEQVGEFDEWQLRDRPERLAMSYTLKAVRRR